MERNFKIKLCLTYANLKLIFNIEYRLISKKGEGTFSEVLKA